MVDPMQQAMEQDKQHSQTLEQSEARIKETQAKEQLERTKMEAAGMKHQQAQEAMQSAAQQPQPGIPHRPM
jgi:hypothetical protein